MSTIQEPGDNTPHNRGGGSGSGSDSGKAKKRERETSTSRPHPVVHDPANSNDNSILDTDTTNTANHPTPAAPPSTTTNFRNVSACNRCRNRKNRCDQKLPKCTNCEKASVRCVGFDPVSKREIPRSYVYYLETRVRNLEAILHEHNIPCPPPSQDFAISDLIKPGINVPFPIQPDPSSPPHPRPATTPAPVPANSNLDPALREPDAGEKLETLVNNVGMVSVQGSGGPHFSDAASGGISFARVVFAAVKSSVQQTVAPTEKASIKTSGTSSRDAGPTMRDSFFGLYTKPTVEPAPFPDMELGLRLTNLYFEHANPQIPVLHRGEFMGLFERVYRKDAKQRTSRELYMLNIVFAIGSGIIVDYLRPSSSAAGSEPSRKKQRLSHHQHQPEEYHSSAIMHLESFLGSSPASEGVGGGLEELQAVLLLAGLALLRPVAPGLWYIIGVAVRLSIDLGLHSEEVDHELDSIAAHPDVHMSNGGHGRKQWTRDLRRRLWWCTFNLDRLVSSCVGRPVSVSEAVVTTKLPSMLDDRYITPAGFYKPPDMIETPSYKLVTRHYVRLRLLQSEIMQVLQQRQADQARRMTASAGDESIAGRLESPFLQPFRSFRQWRVDIDRRLLAWKEQSPPQYETGVDFNPLFLELNYWQAVIMLYRQSLSVPEQLAGELSPATGEDVHSPGNVNFELEEDKQTVFLKVAEAGQVVLRIYRQLHRLKLVNYTFLATHHLFISGISFLYAIWHCTVVRSHMNIDDVDFTVLAATSVLSDLVPICPPAEACRDAFVRMSKATISMVMNTTGFGTRSTLGTQPLTTPESYGTRIHDEPIPQAPPPPTRRQMPKFDMNLQDLFSEEEIASRPFTYHHHHHRPKPQGFPRHAPKKPRSQHAPISPQLSTSTSAAPGREGTPPPTLRPPPAVSATATATTAQHHHHNHHHHHPRDEGSSPSSHSHPLPSPTHQPRGGSHGPHDGGDPLSHPTPDFSFDHLDFLHDFPAVDPGAGAGFWGQANHDASALGFGSGGASGGFEAFQANELMDEFWFGASGSGGYYA